MSYVMHCPTPGHRHHILFGSKTVSECSEGPVIRETPEEALARRVKYAAAHRAEAVSRKDPVTADVRRAVLLRDRMCILARLHPDHVCRDVWGFEHPSDDLGRLTLDHVHDGYGLMGRRAPSDAGHLVALCGLANVSVPSHEDRVSFREYLASVAV